MPGSIEHLVKRIHASPTRFVLALTGGGAGAIAALTTTPGASRTLLEAVIPYSSESIISWLGGRPDQFCSAETACRMAMVALFRAQALAAAEVPLAGVACTASLATDRPKRGPHRAHVAIQTTSFTATRSVELLKSRRTREVEEKVVSRLLLNAVAEAGGHEAALDLGLLEGEHLVRAQTIAPPAWQDLLLGRAAMVRHGPAPRADEPVEGKVVFPGAFNPLHAGHRDMARLAEDLLGRPVEFEISIVNPDKPPIDFHQMKRRVEQFGGKSVVWLTRAPTFVEKAKLFPGATFVVGSDTLRRIGDPRYYGDDLAACQAVLRRMAARGCHFLVFGRNLGTGFVGLHHLDLPEPLAAICREVPAEQFREDVSSTELRRAALEEEDRGSF